MYCSSVISQALYLVFFSEFISTLLILYPHNTVFHRDAWHKQKNYRYLPSQQNIDIPCNQKFRSVHQVDWLNQATLPKPLVACHVLLIVDALLLTNHPDAKSPYLLHLWHRYAAFQILVTVTVVL